MTGEASVAIIRQQPRMGYELTFKAVLTGVENTYLQGMECELEIEELCDDGGDPEGYDISVTTVLDTQQGSVAKEVVGYSNDCDVFTKEIRRVLNDYPNRVSN